MQLFTIIDSQCYQNSSIDAARSGAQVHVTWPGISTNEHRDEYESIVYNFFYFITESLRIRFDAKADAHTGITLKYMFLWFNV